MCPRPFNHRTNLQSANYETDSCLKETGLHKTNLFQLQITGRAFTCYFPLLVTMAKLNYCSRGERLCILLVIWNYPIDLSDFKKEGPLSCMFHQEVLDCFFIYHTLDTLHSPNGKSIFCQCGLLILRWKAISQNSNWLISNFI